MKLGVDLGGTNIAVGLTDDNGVILAKGSRPTGAGRAKETLAADIKAACLEVCAKAGAKPEDIEHIGLGVPGSINKKTVTLVYGTNLFVENLCFAQAFQPEFPCPVFLDNDANCAALGEYYGGAGKGSKSMVMVTLGTGVGGGIVVNGELYSGFNDIAGEIGHMVIKMDGYPCNCGRRGCWEAYASATGLIRMAKEAMEQNPASALHQTAKEEGKVSALAVFLARDRGDAAAKELVQRYLKYLACGINNLIAILQPEKIVLGGGIAGQGEKLLQPLRELVNKDLFKADCKQAELVLAEAGNDAGIIGAAMLQR